MSALDVDLTLSFPALENVYGVHETSRALKGFRGIPVPCPIAPSVFAEFSQLVTNIIILPRNHAVSC